MNKPLYCSHLAYLAAATLLLTMHLSFFVSVWQGYIDWCNPYWADCVSISRSGRHGLAYFIFKGGMLPAALMLAVFWQLNCLWLRSMDIRDRACRMLVALGWIASLALLIYTLSLGHSGETFRSLRRFGVVSFLGLSFINFALLASALKKTPLQRQGRYLQNSSAAILTVAILSLALDALLGAGYDRLENAFEWWLVLLLISQLFGVALMWERSGFELAVKIAEP